jgi:hypothetical protein
MTAAGSRPSRTGRVAAPDCLTHMCHHVHAADQRNLHLALLQTNDHSTAPGLKGFLPGRQLVQELRGEPGLLPAEHALVAGQRKLSTVVGLQMTTVGNGSSHSSSRLGRHHGLSSMPSPSHWPRPGCSPGRTR